MSTQVTPVISRFAEATIEKIDTEVIPALKAAHDMDIKLSHDELQKFGELRTSIQSKKVEIGQKDEVCSTRSHEHQECREEEHTYAVRREECQTHSSTSWKEVEQCEDTLSVWESNIDSIWCEQVFDALSEDFYNSNKDLMAKYMHSSEKCTTERESHHTHYEECQTIVQQVTEKRTVCGTKQEHLEECSCERANLVDEYTDKYTLEWSNMTSMYLTLVGHLRNESEGRKREFRGLHVVKCLLVQVKLLGVQDGPCDETHVQQVEAEIKACHEEIHDDTDYDFDPEDPPELETPIYEHAPYPCQQDFIALHYSHLPADAAAKACHDTHCVPRLRPFEPEIVMGRPYTTDGGNLLADVQFAENVRSVWTGPALQHQANPDGWTREIAQIATEHWVRSGQHEHASVASFSRASLDILKFAGPPELVSATHQAALEEVRHAQLAFSLAEAFNSDREKQVDVGQFPFDQVTLASSLAELSSQVLTEGCMGETEAVTKMSFALAHLLPNSPAASVLPPLIEEEAKHAALAWKTLQWSLQSSPSRNLQIQPSSGAVDQPQTSPLLLTWAGIVPASSEMVLVEKVRTGIVQPWLRALQDGAVQLPAVHLGAADASSKAVEKAAALIRGAFNSHGSDHEIASI